MIIQNQENREKVASAVYHLLTNNYSPNIFKRLINELLWSATCDFERKDDIKYKKKYWSMEALNLREQNIVRGIDRNKGLVHEHTIPRNLIYQKLISLNNPTYNDVLSVINGYEYAVVISKREDNMMNANPYLLRQSLPMGYSINDPVSENLILSRYITCRIELFEIDTTTFQIIRPKLTFNDDIETIHI